MQKVMIGVSISDFQGGCELSDIKALIELQLQHPSKSSLNLKKLLSGKNSHDILSQFLQKNRHKFL